MLKDKNSDKCNQIMHIGGYEEEQASIDKIDAF